MSYFCLSMSSWFLSHSAHLGLQLGDFFLVRDSFFHFVREEMGPRRELGIVLCGGGGVVVVVSRARLAEIKHTCGTQDGS